MLTLFMALVSWFLLLFGDNVYKMMFVTDNINVPELVKSTLAAEQLTDNAKFQAAIASEEKNLFVQSNFNKFTPKLIHIKRYFQADAMNGTQVSLGDGSMFRGYETPESLYLNFLNQSSRLPVML